LRGEALALAVGADHDEPERPVVGRLEGIDGGAEPLAREARADEKEQRVARLAADPRPLRAAQLGAKARIEMLEVHAAVDHVQLFRRDTEGAPDLIAHHARVADHGAQAWMLEEAALGRADVAVIRIERDAEAF